MKNYTITVNGNVYEVTVEEGFTGKAAAPKAAAPVQAPKAAPAPAAAGIQIDRKRLAQLRQKRVALGHKPDDHELEQQQGFSMKFH